MVVGILLGAGLIVLVSRPPRGRPVILRPPPTPLPVLVHVTGAVLQPGLYSLPPGSRVQDAILAAGGFSASADEQGLNLAAVLLDGSRVNVPSIVTPESGSSGLSKEATSTPTFPIDLNTATLAELDSLPGIGPVTAQAIIDYRDQNGPFARIQDIDRVPGIGPATYEQIKDLITIGYGN